MLENTNCPVQINNMYETVPVVDAVGMTLAHDITEIRRGEFKGRAFKKGHIITSKDVDHLRRLGKESIYVLQIKEDEMHENEAAEALARSLAGDGVGFDGEVKEGKINLTASTDGLLQVNTEALTRFNMMGSVMCATLHNNTVVKKGQTVAGTRAIPLVVKKADVDEAVGIANNAGKIISVLTMKRLKVGLIITGNEVYSGLIKDKFYPVMSKKMADAGCEIIEHFYCPDDVDHISAKMRHLLDGGAEMLILTGGLSVDPDDVTRFALRGFNVSDFLYGTPVLPGSMFLLAYIEKGNRTVPVLGTPACGMYSKITVFDLVVPRVLAGKRLVRADIAEMAHGGLCLTCEKCTYPVCSFGK